MATPAAPSVPSMPSVAAATTPTASSAPPPKMPEVQVPGGEPRAPAAAGVGQPPATGGQAAIPAAAATPAAPKNTDFPNTAEGQVQFLSALKQWEKENPKPAGEAAPAASSGVTADDKAAAAQLGAQPGEKPAGEAAPAAPAAAVTPQALADLMEKTPALKAALEGSPEARDAVFGMARRAAELEPIAQIFPTVGDAEFAQQHAQELVGLKTLSMRAIHQPETVPELLGAFDSQFAVVDNDGKPVLDSNGQPTYAEDRKVFQDALVARDLSGYKETIVPQIEQLKAKLANSVYPNEAARALDEKKLQNLDDAHVALRVVDQIRSGEWFQEAPPEIPADAPAEFRTWAEQQRAQLEAAQHELEGKKKGANEQERKQQRAAFQNAVRTDMGTAVGTIIAQKMNEIMDSGVYIPEMYIQDKLRDANGNETNIPAIAARLFQQFENKLMQAGSRTLMEITQHELLPENEQTRAIRKEWYARRAAEIVPDLVKAEVDRIQGLIKLDLAKQNNQQKDRNAVAQPEPHSAGSGLPQGASDAQLRTQAEEMAKKDPNFTNATPAEKQARIVTQYNRLRGGAQRK